MTNETRNRIEAYKKALPEMKERVMAGAFLLVMSIMMMTSASFAWITLSRAPEVAGMQTTVASNGNLEIALAQGSTSEEAVAPGESQAGDSSAAEGQSIVEANGTWGNLVNVSDPTYGVGDIALRPALLSAYNRTDYPLNGAVYGSDGRVVTTNDRYEFASYELVEGKSDQYYFAAGDKVNYGVRAISSVGYQNLSGTARVDNYRNDTNQLYMDAQDYYGKIVAEEPNEVNTLNAAGGVTCITALERLVTVFAQDKINQMGYGPDGEAGKESKTSCSEHLWYTYQMMLLLENALKKEGKALLEMANWQAYVDSGDYKIENTFTSIDEVIEASKEKTTVAGKTMTVLEAKGVTLTTLDSYIDSVEGLEFCINGDGSEKYPGIKPMAEKCQNPDAPEGEYYWDDISAYVNKLVEINSTTMCGKKLSEINGIGDAMEILGGGDVVVYHGILKDIESRMVNDDNRVYAKVKVHVKTSIIGERDVNGVVYTDARGKAPLYAKDLELSDSIEGSARGDATAKETYGLALDVWVRTNYPDAVLTLEGAAKYENKRATTVIEGTEYNLYTISVGEDETKREEDVYQKEDKWYYASGMGEVSSSDLGNQTPSEKYVPVIVGYEGENRVWEDWRDLLENGFIEQDATTQGAGSCFVFYADTPSEQAKIMEMLEAFNVAFMNQNGDILGTAKLNLDSAYANQGKVTVPLEVESGTDYTDESGLSHKGITKLTKNTPTMITAIVYLNGSKLSNENVLAEGELQGQLNIQFGTDSVLIAPDNEELQLQARTITATVTVGDETISNGTIDGPENLGLEYKAEGHIATVELTVEGEQPEQISGFFIRVINSTQGTRGESVDFVKNADGKWTADFTLTNPGTYAFNTLLVDGVNYMLHDGSEQSGMSSHYEPNRPYVHIQGLKVSSVAVDVEPGVYMTAETSMNFPVTVKVDAAVEPKQVNAQFFSLDGKKQYTAILTYDSINKEWEGSTNISSSDTYALKYISVNGMIIDAPVTGNYTLYLGLRANVSTTVPKEDRTYEFKGIRQFEMIAKIYDDSGKSIENLSDVKLYYSNMSPAMMTWNGTQYEGVLEATRPGQMNFTRLELGTAGKISNVKDAPEFLAITLEKPEYVSGEAKLSKATVIGDGLNATMSVDILNGESAVVYAEMQRETSNEETEVHYIEGSLENTVEISSTQIVSTYTFTLPKEDGIWTLKRLFLQNVYDKDIGRFYDIVEGTPTESNSLILLPKDDEKLSTDVVASYNVAVFYNGEKRGSYKSTDDKSTPDIFNISLNGETPGAFLAEYTTSPITVEITDYMGRKIDTMTEEKTQLKLSYASKSSVDYGGYKVPSDATPEFEDISANDKTMSFGTMSLKHAGEYNTNVFQVSLGTAGIIDIMVRPKFTISSVKPTLTISGITPTGSNPAKVTYTTKSLGWRGTEPTFTATGNQTSTFSANSATIYAVATADNDSQRHGSFKNPTLTLTVDGVNSNSVVSVILPGGDADEIVFSRTGDGSMTKTLGKVSQINSWTSNFVYTHTLSAYYGHKTQTISSMKITNGGVDYTVTFDTPIIINNPSSVNQ